MNITMSCDQIKRAKHMFANVNIFSQFVNSKLFINKHHNKIIVNKSILALSICKQNICRNIVL